MQSAYVCVHAKDVNSLTLSIYGMKHLELNLQCRQDNSRLHNFKCDMYLMITLCK